ncbi:MAG: biopolymer transporter ExbD [Elusimicrobia bacterium]|nr:biopolymer transporter ExbD [Elusimicrobiota bacterium]
MRRRHFDIEEMKEISEVNVVPLADVSLVLLIILLLLSPMLTQAVLKVQVASGGGSSPSTASVPTPGPLVVSIQSNGFFVGNKVFSDLNQLAYAVMAELRVRKEKKVLVAPYPQILHGEVVRVLDLMKQCGADSVSLVKRG